MQTSFSLAASLAAILAVVGTLCACSPAVETPAEPDSSNAPQTAATPYAEFNTTATIRDVMNTLVDPSADALWNAVRYEVDAEGSRELRPETDEQWQTLRYHAVAIIEGGNSLMLPGRRVAPAGATTEFPAYEYMPEEVAVKLQEDRQSWLVFARGLQSSALAMLGAIEARDVDKLSEFGAALDSACEACHSQYWYRAEAQ